MPDVQITVKPNGPYVVSGEVVLLDSSGAPYRLEKTTIALCRCGQSENKPFCDGTHAQIGFSAPVAGP
ncbi:MAG: CDGSH iron-sulfur domain-containing protein [Thermoleophilia bacterium]|nr:CDGSH iron-sulfur domain-containing protein [Thermoleophilia bacterium]